MLHKYEFAIKHIHRTFECPNCDASSVACVEPRGCTSRGDYFDTVDVDCASCEQRLTMEVDDWYRNDEYRPRPVMGDVIERDPSPLYNQDVIGYEWPQYQ